MPDDVVIAKVEIIENCLRRLDEVYAGKSANLFEDLTRQDSILLNLERACQASVDLALRVIRIRKLGLPKESREAFEILERHGLIDADLSRELKSMVGFRNLAVHNYRAVDLHVVERILNEKPAVFRRLNAWALTQF